jgi:hypothetical protein
MAPLREATRQIGDDRLRPAQLGLSDRRDQWRNNGDAHQAIVL